MIEAGCLSSAVLLSRDPRNGAPATRHYFGEVLFIALAAMLCGMDSCEDFVRL